MATANASPLPNPKANPADPNKVMRMAFPVPETGFDPVRVNDLYSNTITAAIFQPLVTYDWMAMPTKLVPDAAEAMPEISKDEKTYTFKIKKGLYFTPDEAFKGVRRELTAYDFVYVFLRHADPKTAVRKSLTWMTKFLALQSLANKPLPVASLITTKNTQVFTPLTVTHWSFN